jgi:hypothetical protein
MSRVEADFATDCSTEILSQSLFETALYLLWLIEPRTPFLAVFPHGCKQQRKNSIRNNLVWSQGLLER